MSNYILEFWGSRSKEIIDSLTTAVVAAGANVSDTKVNFVKDTVKFYIILQQSDKHTIDSFLAKLSQNEKVWHRCSWCYRVKRGTGFGNKSEDEILKYKKTLLDHEALAC